MNIIRRNIPNSITCLNLIGGVMAIVAAHFGGHELWGLIGLQWSWLFIALSAVADFCDGLAARSLGAYSELGKELDSLCDNVSFGVAPAFALYVQLTGLEFPAWGAVALLAIPVCGVLRLARFNTAEEDNSAFTGLPIPGNAIFWIGYMAAIDCGNCWLTKWSIAVPVILLEAWLMVSPLKMYTFKFKSLGWRGNEVRWVIIGLFVLLTAITGVQGLLWGALAYILLSIVFPPKK